MEEEMIKTQDLRVKGITPLRTPRGLKQEFPASDEVLAQVLSHRSAIERIIAHDDSRMLAIVGPCSVRDEEETLYYAKELLALSRQVHDTFFVVMRVYVEKPRTTIGWKGLINDPHLDGSYDLDFGLAKARLITLRVAELGLPIAMEVLDPFNIRYLSDLLSWGSIGARTVESQVHREIASGLSMPVGFKNSTEGGIKAAVDAIEAASHPHVFRGIDDDGRISRIMTSGNPFGHVVLRGGGGKTNYDDESLSQAAKLLSERGFLASIVVDCSHGNSGKQYQNQHGVFRSILKARIEGNSSVVGLMLESHIHEGRQDIPKDLSELKFGVSVTDACINLADTQNILRRGSELLGAPTYSI